MLIGEVARQSGLSTRMLRHYDRVGLLTPTGRTTGNYREYTEADIQRLLHIEALRSLGLTLAQVAEVLGDASFDPAAVIAEVIAQAEENIVRTRELVARLEAVHDTQPRSWADVLHTVGLLRALESPTPSQRQRSALTGAATDQDAAVLVAALLREPHADAAGALQWALSRTGDAALPALVEALDAPDELPRRRALDALEKIGSPAAREAIAAAVDSGDPRVRARATLTRGQLGDTAALPGLVGLIRGGMEDIAAADVLARLVRESDLAGPAVEALVAALHDAGTHARRRLAAALGEVSGPEAADALASLLDDDDPGTALTARALLSRRPPHRMD